MKRNFLKLSALLIGLIMLASVTACTNETNKTLIMGTNAAFEPFEYLSGSEVVGFDVDIANEIAKDGEMELVIEDIDFDGLISALSSGKIDMIVAGMSVTEERKKNVDFSDPYFTSSQVIIVRTDETEIKGAADLEGKIVGVQQGTTGDLFVSDTANAKEVVGFKSGVDAGIELSASKIDAVVIDEQPAKKIISANPGLKILSEKFTEEEYAIAVKKGNTELLNAINQSLTKLRDSGKYDTIYGKYFGTAE